MVRGCCIGLVRRNCYHHTVAIRLDPSGFDDLCRNFTLVSTSAKLGLRHIHRLASVLGNPVAQSLPPEQASDVLPPSFLSITPAECQPAAHTHTKWEVETGDTSLPDCWNLRSKGERRAVLTPSAMSLPSRIWGKAREMGTK